MHACADASNASGFCSSTWPGACCMPTHTGSTMSYSRPLMYARASCQKFFIRQYVQLPSSYIAMPATSTCHARQEKVEALAELLYVHLCKYHLEMIKSTGSLTPTYSMRHRCTRERMSWATALNGRWFTNALVKSSLQHLLQTHDDVIIPANTPGFSMDSWLTSTADKLAQLLQRARRSTVAVAMDNMETQAWDLDLNEDWPCAREIQNICWS